MTLQFGVEPIHLPLVLVEGSDFVSTLVSDNGPWAPDTEIAVEVGDQRWIATLDGDKAHWEVDKAVVLAVIRDVSGNPTPPEKWKLFYKEGSADLVWAKGGVIVDYD